MVRIQVGANYVFCSQNRPYRLWNPFSLLLSGSAMSLYGLRRPGREVKHLPQSRAIVYEYCYIFVPSISFHDVARKNFAILNTLPMYFNSLGCLGDSLR